MSRAKTTNVQQDIAWPARCPTCGEGEIVPLARSGRLARYKNLAALPIPANLEIPTCQACGVEWIDHATAMSVDTALEGEYQKRLRKLAIQDMEKLAAQNIPQRSLEKLLGLSQGYLSKIRSGASRPSPMLVGCLHLLASDPQRRIREMEESFAPA